MSAPFDIDSLFLTDENDLFLDLVKQLTPDRRRIVDVLLRKLAAVEEAEGETAALSLIDDVSSILATTPTTH
ncbi:MAG TPA: hypothetical protein PLF78_11610 [Caulobacter sp.]|nr:hypothetical protein [Caulobacter sp.]